MKNKFIKSSIYVILLGLMAKIISMLVKIYSTRIYGLELMSIYSLVNPMMIFIIVFVQLSLPLALSKLVAQNKEKKKSYLLSAYMISLSISMIVMLILIFGAEYIALNIYKNINTKHSIMAIGIYAPLVTLTSIYKGYLIGNEKIEITSFSQIIEEIARLFFIYLTSSFFISKNIDYASMGIIIGMWIGEIFQMISLLLTNYKNKFRPLNIFTNILTTEANQSKVLLNISIPITLSRLITSFTFSIEPIIYTNIMINNNYTPYDIAESYGILQTYVNPILFLPSFFISSISLILLPSLSKIYYKKNYKQCKKLFLKSLYISIIIGLLSSMFIFIFSEELLNLLYKTNKGNTFIRILAFPYIFYYIDSILNITLHAINKEKISLIITSISSIIRIILLYLLVPIFNILGIEIAMLISVLLVIITNSFFIRRHLFLNI